MKNIHLLPTDKPSILYKRNDLKNYYLGDFDICNPNDNLRTNQHIYITSDEEIKVNDYITDGYKVWQWKDDSSLLGRKKVILSTDQDLNGVQAIDDDFLEWFVKNPSCEEVEVEHIKIDDARPSGYKIIIPKEEQKQNLIDMMQDDERLGLYQNETMTNQDKTNVLFKIWLDSGMTKTDFAIKCGWKNSSNFCGMISGRHRVTYEHLEKACKVTNRKFKIEIR